MTLKKFVNIISFLITIFSLYYFTSRILVETDEIVEAVGILLERKWIIATEILLLLLNFFFEAKRWQTIVNQDIRFTESLKTTLMATAYGNATFFGFGEHFARSFHQENVKDYLLKSVVASIFQTVVITVFGIFSILVTNFNTYSFIKILIIIILCLAIIYLLIKRLRPKWISFVFEPFRNYKRLTVIKILIFNILRYITFSSQFYLLLTLSTNFTFNIGILLPIYYLAITLLPGLKLLDIGIRGSVALYVFANVVPESLVSVAVLSIWVINIIVPSIFGIIVYVSRSISEK